MSAAAPPVLVEGDDRVLWVTLNRPEARNAIDEGMVAGLEAAIAQAEASGVRTVVIRGAGGTFCAGADLKHVRALRSQPGKLEDFVTRLADVLDRLEAGPFASVAVVEGFALAGGCELLLACDIVVATEDAQIGDRHLEYGLLPGAGGSVRLERSLPKARSRFVLLSGEMLPGRAAADWGLVTMAVAPDALDDTIRQLVELLERRSADAIAGMKEMVTGGRDLPADEAVRHERKVFVAHVEGSPDVEEGLSAFAERREPAFADGARATRTT